MTTNNETKTKALLALARTLCEHYAPRHEVAHFLCEVGREVRRAARHAEDRGKVGLGNPWIIDELVYNGGDECQARDAVSEMLVFVDHSKKKKKKNGWNCGSLASGGDGTKNGLNALGDQGERGLDVPFGHNDLGGWG